MAEEQSLTINIGQGPSARAIAVRRSEGATPGVVWLGGFKSDMTGTKAEALARWAASENRAFLRFDYSGHGASGGRFEAGTMSAWLEESLAVIRALASGPQVLVGSSMGGWLALLAERALRREGGPKISGLVLIAPAVDFTERLMWARFSQEIRDRIEHEGFAALASAYSDEPTIVTRDLIQDGRKQLLLGAPIEVGCPVHILQGVCDPDVPWAHATELVSRLGQDDVVLTLIKDGDHRLSRPGDIDRLVAAVAAMCAGWG